MFYVVHLHNRTLPLQGTVTTQVSQMRTAQLGEIEVEVRLSPRPWQMGAYARASTHITAVGDTERQANTRRGKILDPTSFL